MANLKLLHVSPTFYPATNYGGPIRSTFALCNSLAKNSEIELRVLSTDAAGPSVRQRVMVESFPVRYEPGYSVYFLRRQIAREFCPGLLQYLWRFVEWADVVHLTGVYSFPTIPTLLFCRMRRRAVVWSPRGSLQATQAWAGVSNLRWKLYWERACKTILPAHTLLHVTSEIERDMSLLRMPGLPSVIIPNGVDVPIHVPPKKKRGNRPLCLMFLGRIDPVKGIENLIHAVGMLPKKSIRLDLFGDGDPTFVREMRELANIQASGCITFHGHVEGYKKANAFAQADICVLPSYSENFGMAIAEALAYGVPVIASKGTPWKYVEARGCGKWVSNEPVSLAKAINDMRDLDLVAMGGAGRRWVLEEFCWDRVASQMSKVYEELTRSGQNIFKAGAQL